MAVAVALTTQCPYCIELHSKRAKKAGATERELAEVTLVLAEGETRACARRVSARRSEGGSANRDQVVLAPGGSGISISGTSAL